MAQPLSTSEELTRLTKHIGYKRWVSSKKRSQPNLQFSRLIRSPGEELTRLLGEEFSGSRQPTIFIGRRWETSSYWKSDQDEGCRLLETIERGGIIVGYRESLA